MTKYLKIVPDPDAKPCRCGDGNPDCEHFEFCPECGEEYKAHEGHDCLDGFAVAQVGTAKELRDAAKELRDSLDACETERDRLRAQLAALQSVPQGVEWIEVSQRVPEPEELVWVCVRNKNKEGGIPLYDMCSLDEDGQWRKRENTWESIGWWAYPVSPESSARLVPTPPQSLQPEERRVGPDEVVVGREEWTAVERLLEWVQSGRVSPNEEGCCMCGASRGGCENDHPYADMARYYWKGLKDQLDAIRTSAQAHNETEKEST